MRLHREQECELLCAGGKREFYPGSVQLPLEPDALPVRAGVSPGAGERAGAVGWGPSVGLRPLRPSLPRRVRAPQRKSFSASGAGPQGREEA